MIVASAQVPAAPLPPVQKARYAMGTMFEIVAYHHDTRDAHRVVVRALDEIVRLDGVMSHFKEGSELSRLNREAHRGFVLVSRSLFEVVEQAVSVSRRSAGVFDITIAPVLRVWKEAHAEGRVPAEADVRDARRCVGFERIDLRPPDRIRFESPCLELDLGGIGKGFAVDRALEILRTEGIQHAVVNGGGSTVGAVGHPPGERGWPVRLGAPVGGRATLLLRDEAISTSQQRLSMLAADPMSAGEIIDPRSAAPAARRSAVSVVAPSATVSDALSTALLLLSDQEALRLLEQYPDVSALWMSASGLQSAYQSSRLTFADSH